MCDCNNSRCVDRTEEEFEDKIGNPRDWKLSNRQQEKLDDLAEEMMECIMDLNDKSRSYDDDDGYRSKTGASKSYGYGSKTGASYGYGGKSGKL